MQTGRITAIVLAGGKSRRMGCDKALLDLQGRPLLVHVVERLKPWFSNIIIAGAPVPDIGIPGCRIIPDLVPGAGPLGGIYSALMASNTRNNFVLAGDMPFFNMDIVAHLAVFAGRYDVVVPTLGRGLEPLHAFYSKTCLGAIRHALDTEAYQVFTFYRDVAVKRVPGSMLSRYDPEKTAFFNVNTHSDYQYALALLQLREKLPNHNETQAAQLIPEMVVHRRR